jgi:uncharacterized protein with NRDE domain
VCTLIVATRVWDDTPLLVAANRDERLERPAEPPRARGDSKLRLFAPLDLEAGGTWWGLNAHGVFAGITNRFGTERDESRRSRGHLVLDALQARNAGAAAEAIAARDPSEHNAFHLVVADAAEAHLVHSDGTALATNKLEQGIHVVTERSLGAGASEREGMARRRLAELARSESPDEEAFLSLLRYHHAASPFESLCVHMDEHGYGTRSSTLVRFGSAPATIRVLHADGPPCRTPHVDLSREAAAALYG